MIVRGSKYDYGYWFSGFEGSGMDYSYHRYTYKELKCGT